MHRSKKWCAFSGALCLFAMLISACGSATIANTPGRKLIAAPPDKQILRLPIGDSDFDTLDPALTNGRDTIAEIFTGLVEPRDDGTIVDQLAAFHRVSSDGLTYTFTLKPDLTFSDGTPLTAQDVAYSINRTVLPATKSTVAGYLNLIKDFNQVNSGQRPTLIGDSIIVKDANTLSITITRPAAYFLEALGYPTSYVVEKKLIDQYGDKWTDHLDQGGGDGPFKVASYVHTRGLELVPNANYYGPKPLIQHLSFLISGDRDTTYKAYLSGQFDDAGVPPAETDIARTRTDFINTPTLTIRYIGLNLLARPLDNLKIRQALALAINKDLIVKTVLRGNVIATNHLVPQGQAGYNAHLTGPISEMGTAGDQTKARQLLQEGLQEAGYANVDALPTITLTSFTGYKAGTDTLSAIIQEWQSVLGINVKLTLIDSNELLQQESATIGNGKLQMWYGVWQADYPDPQDWLSIFFGKGSDHNFANYGQNNTADVAQQQAVQNQLAQADVNLNTVARMQAYNKAEQQIVNDVAWIPTYQSAYIMVLNPKVQNYHAFNALGVTAPDDWGSIYIAQ
ncbi:MAG TPA: peptide ABC transporter substrate-binding protein [Ktedonosporobacter sp.]|nr:peptide ABC transporter substrate-binding protein [Ktedonosporobacter sp.]